MFRSLAQPLVNQQREALVLARAISSRIDGICGLGACAAENTAHAFELVYHVHAAHRRLGAPDEEASAGSGSAEPDSGGASASDDVSHRPFLRRQSFFGADS